MPYPTRILAPNPIEEYRIPTYKKRKRILKASSYKKENPGASSYKKENTELTHKKEKNPR
jgi:hypothetical protein